MKKTAFTIGGLFLFAIILIIILLLSLVSSKKPFPQVNIPTIPTPSPIVIIGPSPIPANQTPLTPIPTNVSATITSTSPSDNSADAPVDSPIIITFNNNIYINSVKITTSPLISFTVSNQANTLTIHPIIPLSFSTKYTVTVNITNQQPQSFSFTTIGGTENPNTDNYLYIRAAYLRTQAPDMFLTYNVPYENNYFSVISPNSDTLQNQYTFVVTLKGDKTLAKNQFLQWLYSLGLTEQQINTLQITYQ